MPKNDKAREKKVNVAVKALIRFPGMRVREAMHFARFSKKEIDNVNVRRIVSRRQFRAAEAAGPPKNVRHDAEATLDVSSLNKTIVGVAALGLNSYRPRRSGIYSLCLVTRGIVALYHNRFPFFGTSLLA